MFDKKFENVDILETLNRILLKNTVHYRKDFEYDKETIIEASESERADDKTLIWMCRPCGTYCFRESDIFKKGISANVIWAYYRDFEPDGILAFAIELKNKQAETIIGDVYPIDFLMHAELVKQKAVLVKEVEIIFEDESRLFSYYEYSRCYQSIFCKYRKGKDFHYIPEAPEKLEALLQGFRSERRKAKKCSADRYINALPVKET